MNPSASLRPHSTWKAFILGLALALSPAIVFAQVAGSINGVVTDTSQAGVPNAELSLSNTQTGETRTAISSAQGFFNFADVPRGESTSVSSSCR